MMNINLNRSDDNNFKNETIAVEKEFTVSSSLQDGNEINHTRKSKVDREESNSKSSDSKSFTDTLNETIKSHKTSIKEEKIAPIALKKDSRGKSGSLKSPKNSIKDKEPEPKKEVFRTDLPMLNVVSGGISATEKDVAVKKGDSDKKVLVKIDKESMQPEGRSPLFLDKLEARGQVNSTMAKSLTTPSVDLGDRLNNSEGEGLLELNGEDALEPVAAKSISKTTNLDAKALPVQQNSEPIIIVTDRRPVTEASVVENSTLSATTQSSNLSDNLRESGNSEIVQRAQIILKEADSGEIRLILKPDNLGTVRININLEENRILGRIIVDSNMVKAAFDDNMADLRDAMLKSGFSGANLDVSVGGKGHGQQQNQQKHQASMRNSGNRVIAGENNFNSETISLVADIINGAQRRLDLEA